MRPLRRMVICGIIARGRMARIGHTDLNHSMGAPYQWIRRGVRRMLITMEWPLP